MKTYILSSEMRASKSGFYVEGTDLEYDIPTEYPLPTETVVIENGKPVHLRLLANCDVLEREAQIERKYPEKTPVDENLRDKLKFRNGMLSVDETRDKMVDEFISRAGWLKSNAKNRAAGTKVIYELYDENTLLQQEVTATEMRIKAQNYIMKLKENDLKNLYGSSVAAGSQVHGVHPVKMKSYLLKVAENNPEYILNALRQEENTVRLFVNKGIDLQVLDFTQQPGEVLLINEATEKMESIASIPNNGGTEIKIDRFVELMKDEEYKEVYDLLKQAVNAKESEMVN